MTRAGAHLQAAINEVDEQGAFDAPTPHELAERREDGAQDPRLAPRPRPSTRGDQPCPTSTTRTPK